MRRLAFLSAVAVSLLAPDARAFSLALDATQGNWSNAVGAPGTTSYATVGSEAQVRWGGDGGLGQSGLGFTGIDVPVTITPGQEFVLGTLRHFNRPVIPPTVSSVDLGVSLAFHDLTHSETFGFTFSILETPNGPPCPFPGVTPCSDKLTFPTQFQSGAFTVGGRTIEIEIVGFRTAIGGPTLGEWVSEENSINTAFLIARVRVLTGGCTYTLGFWKNHPSVWPVSHLVLGTRDYTKAELLKIFAQPVRGNGLVSLAHQLIAAKLNAFNWAATPDDVEAGIQNGDLVIGALVVPPIGSGSLKTSVTSSLTAQLDGYNNGKVRGTPHCK